MVPIEWQKTLLFFCESVGIHFPYTTQLGPCTEKQKKSNPQLFMIYLKLIIWGITQKVKNYFFQAKKKDSSKNTFLFFYWETSKNT